MSKRSAGSNRASQSQLPTPALTASLFGDLYWYLQVVEAGSFSGAAERTGVAKSSLSRRVAQLERQLGVQLLNRNTRLFAMSTVGEQVYRHALDMLAAAESARECALNATGTPGGLVRIGVPSILSDWTLELLATFRNTHPAVQFALTLQDNPGDLVSQRLDLSLSLNDVPKDSAAVVARPLALLKRVVAGSPALLEAIGQPRSLADVEDEHLLTLASPTGLTWQLRSGARQIRNPALSADSAQALLQGAGAGLGLACLPLCACLPSLESGALKLACQDEGLPSATLYALTPPHRGITSTARKLIDHIRQELSNRERPGVSVLFS